MRAIQKRTRRPAPKKQTEAQFTLVWDGELTHTAGVTCGYLADPFGWRLRLAATSEGPGKLLVAATMEKLGQELGPWTDDGLRGALTDHPWSELAGALIRTEAGWRGTLAHTIEGSIQVTGAQAEPGRLVLRGEG